MPLVVKVMTKVHNLYNGASQLHANSKFKAQLTIVFFAAVNHNFGDGQRNLENRNKQKWIEIYQSQPTDATFLVSF